MSLKVRNRQLAKLREFRKGMDIEDFLQNEFKQILRALQHQYVSGSYIETESCGDFSAIAMTSVKNLSLKIKTSGGRLCVGLAPDGSSNSSFIGASNTTSSCLAVFNILRNNVVVASTRTQSSHNGSTSSLISMPPGSLILIENNLPAGEYNYEIKAQGVSGSALIKYSKLFAYEF